MRGAPAQHGSDLHDHRPAGDDHDEAAAGHVHAAARAVEGPDEGPQVKVLPTGAPETGDGTYAG
ncbi:hypothetical protein [Amycolatopsis thermoflava]|uniref:hypothetical protein n=1 Tax=Amycolatopsis thermoflava TaxID=84480 RepID=UPI000423B2A1|nr:hypothetical protein [Amycolatopsis thermoflava]